MTNKAQHIAKMAKEMYGTDKITTAQLAYITDMLTPSTYLLRNHSVRNHPITFMISGRDQQKAQAHRPWQVKIINDQHRTKAVIKSRQLGLSEMGVGTMLHFADTHSYDAVKCLYTFPTNEQMTKFVQTRLDPVLQRGYYSTIIDPEVDSLKAKKIRNSFLYFRSSSKPGAVEGVDIDYLSMDEYDRVPALAEASALESMSSSPYKIVTRWSTPSAPDVGIHALFEQSDQYWYLHKCDKCNHYNQMNYEDYVPEAPVERRGNILCVNPKGVDPIAKTVVDGSFQFVCQKCGEPLDRWYNGVWVPKYPDRTKNGLGIRGYMISQMNAVWVSADQLKTKELTSLSKQAFYNYTLGYPYADQKLTVNASDVERNRRGDLPESPRDRGDYKFISVGIDWGNRHWVSIHGVRTNGQVDLIKLFSVGKANPLNPDAIDTDIQSIRLQLAPYEPDIIVADVGDSGDKVAKLIQIYGKDRVFGCVYPSTPKSTGNLVPSWNVQGNKVSADKLMQNKRYISNMKDGVIGFYHKMDSELMLYIEHWGNVVIRDEEDEKSPTGFRQTIGRKGDDHYSQASVYSMLGYEHLMNVFTGADDYGFNSDWISTQLAPTPPDIFTQFT